MSKSILEPGPEVLDSLTWFKGFTMTEADRTKAVKDLIRAIELYEMAMLVVELNPETARKQARKFRELHQKAQALKDKQPNKRLEDRSKFGSEYTTLTDEFKSLKLTNQLQSTEAELKTLLDTMKQIWEDETIHAETVTKMENGREILAEARMQEARNKVFEATKEAIDLKFISKEEDEKKFIEALQRKSPPPALPLKNRVADQPEDVRSSGSSDFMRVGLFRESFTASVSESIPESENSGAGDIISLTDIIDQPTAAALGLKST